MEHLSLDDLADLLAAEGSADAEAHVASCAGCAGRLDELATAEVEVAAVLASLPAPAVPDDLAARLQAAFDAEPALVPAEPSGGGPLTGDGAAARGAGGPAAGGSATVTPFPAARPRGRRSLAPLSAAAAVLVLAAGAVFGLGQLGGGSGDDAATSADGGAASAEDAFGDLARNETGTDYAADGTLAAALPALVGGSAAAFSAPLSAPAEDAAAKSGGDQRTGAGAEPQPAQESESLTATSQGVPPQDAPGAVGGGGADGLSDARLSSSALDRLRTPEGLASCLAALLPPEEPELRPLAVDYAAYAGQPALVVVLPATGGAAKVDVFVVGAGCTTGDDQTLFFGRFDAP